MRLTIKIPTYIEVYNFKKDHKAFLNYLSKYCIYLIEQSEDGYGYITTVVAPVQKKEVHRILDNYFKLFLEEIDEMKDTDFERLADKIKGLSQDDIKKIWLTLDKQHDASLAIGVWHKFKALHPNTPEIPDYSEASVKRWLYHINEAEKNVGFKKVELDMGPIEALRSIKGVTRFEDFTEEQKKNYQAISVCYPGSQVFACGSQVRGDYIPSGGSILAVKARELAGMKTKGISDYDYWIHPNVLNASILPEYSDRYRGKFNEKEMVAIPIYYGDV